MADRRLVTLENGVSVSALSAWEGRSIADLREDPVAIEMLNLTGSETFRVYNADGNEETRWSEDDDVLSLGDRVVFSRESGTKGSN